jgi:zinc/manganese transport system substrate-binding protein
MQPIRSDRHRWHRAIVGGALCLLATSTQALTVFACEPEWAALVRELAPHARVHTATHALQDPHHIEARPSLIAALRRADLAVCTGAELEAGWLPMLQQRAGNPRVHDRAEGMFFASDHVELIDPQPEGGGPFAGDVHAAGNPHIHLDPNRIREVAEALTRQLQALEPQQQQQYQQRWADFDAQWQTRIAQWERKAAPLRGMKVAAQHSTFAYFWRWLHIEQVADLEPRPGMPPTPGHLQGLLTKLRSARPEAVVATTYQDGRSARWLAGQLGPDTPALSLPATVTETAPAPSLPALFDHLIEQLLAAHR